MDNPRSRLWLAMIGMGFAVVSAAIIRVGLINNLLTEPAFAELAIWLVVIALGVTIIVFSYQLARISDRVKCWHCSAKVPRDCCAPTVENKDITVCCVCTWQRREYPFGTKDRPQVSYCNECERATYLSQLSLPRGLFKEPTPVSIDRAKLAVKQSEIVMRARLICPDCLELWGIANPDPSTLNRIDEM